MSRRWIIVALMGASGVALLTQATTIAAHEAVPGKKIRVLITSQHALMLAHAVHALPRGHPSYPRRVNPRTRRVIVSGVLVGLVLLVVVAALLR